MKISAMLKKQSCHAEIMPFVRSGGSVAACWRKAVKKIGENGMEKPAKKSID
jgi:hypothetical protein